MSTWGTIDAEVQLAGYAARTDEELLQLVADGLPTGSEDGPTVRVDSGAVRVYGRLRDVTDRETSTAVLAWFARLCEWWSATGTLTWEIDDGPRYRYRAADGELTRLRGVLDF